MDLAILQNCGARSLSLKLEWTRPPQVVVMPTFVALSQNSICITGKLTNVHLIFVLYIIIQAL